MRIKDLLDIDGKNANGQRVSLLNPEKVPSRHNNLNKRSYSAASTLQIRPSGRRQEHGVYDVYDSHSDHRKSSHRDSLHLERMYSTGSASTNSSASSASTMRSDLYDRERLSQTPPTPDYLEESNYEDPESCNNASPYPSYQGRSTSYGSYPYATTLEPSFQQNSLDSGLHNRLLDLTVRQRSQDIVSPLNRSPNNTTLPSFGQAFSNYVISPHQPTSYERETHNTSPKSAYFSSPQTPPRTSSEVIQKRPSLRVEIHPSSASSNSQPSPISSDDSSRHRRPEPRKSLSASATRGPSERHRYPCPLADEYDCRSYFTTSGHASRHAKKHTGKRDAECPECHRCFTRKDNMEQHRRTHSKEGKAKKKIAVGDMRKRISVNSVAA